MYVYIYMYNPESTSSQCLFVLKCAAHSDLFQTTLSRPGFHQHLYEHSASERVGGELRGGPRCVCCSIKPMKSIDIQGGAPKIAKLVYNSNNYGL